MNENTAQAQQTGPQWQQMTADQFSTKPRATQAALFATGDDGQGTGSLFADADGDEPTFF